MELGTEKGASTWLTALPLQEQGFTLNKQEFQDALCGLTITKHNDIHDITAN